MARERTDCDVTVAIYDTTKQTMTVISFFNDTQLLLDCKRVKLIREGDLLYFEKGDDVVGSVKLSGEFNDKIQICKDYDMFKDMQGKYDLKHDTQRNVYYINLQEKVGEYHPKFRLKGTKQLNHNPGVREYVKIGPRTKVSLTEHGRRVVEDVRKQEQKEKTSIVVKALIELLKSEIAGNAEALSTVETLEKYIGI